MYIYVGITYVCMHVCRETSMSMYLDKMPKFVYVYMFLCI